MGKRGFEPKIKEIHLRKIIYKSHRPEVYKKLEECIEVREGVEIVNSDTVNHWRVEGGKQLERIQSIALKRDKWIKTKSNKKYLWYSLEEIDERKIWRGVTIGCNRLIDYNKEWCPPVEVLPQCRLISKIPTDWLDKHLDWLGKQYRYQREENTNLGTTVITDYMKFLMSEIKRIGRELKRRGFIKKPKENIFEDTNVHLIGENGEIALGIWDDKQERYDYDINVDINSKDDVPSKHFFGDECQMSNSEHCTICPYSKDCIQKNVPKEELKPIPKKSPSEIVDDFFKERNEEITPTTAQEIIAKEKEKKSQKVKQSEKGKSPPVID